MFFKFEIYDTWTNPTMSLKGFVALWGWSHILYGLSPYRVGHIYRVDRLIVFVANRVCHLTVFVANRVGS